MVTIKQYQNGMAGKAVKQSVMTMRSTDGPLPEGDFRQQLTGHTAHAEPKLINLSEAGKLIDQSRACAVGDRTCYHEFENVPHTSCVFLDELAEALDEVGKAKLVSKEMAKEAIAESKKHPIIISKVNGKYMEICRTYPETCLYWNMEQKGIRCIARRKAK